MLFPRVYIHTTIKKRSKQTVRVGRRTRHRTKQKHDERTESRRSPGADEVKGWRLPCKAKPIFIIFPTPPPFLCGRRSTRGSCFCSHLPFPIMHMHRAFTCPAFPSPSPTSRLTQWFLVLTGLERSLSVWDSPSRMSCWDMKRITRLYYIIRDRTLDVR